MKPRKKPNRRGDPKERYSFVVHCADPRVRAEWALCMALSKLLDKTRNRPRRYAEDIMRDILFQRRRVLCRHLKKLGVDYLAELGIKGMEKPGRGHHLAMAYAPPKEWRGRKRENQHEARPSMVTRYDAGMDLGLARDRACSAAARAAAAERGGEAVPAAGAA